MNTRHILVIEDDVIVAKMLNTILQRSGFQVTNAYDGHSGLELYKRLRFPVCIIDLGIPLMAGDILIDEIRKIDPSAVILVETAHDDKSTIIEIMKKGVFDYIIKPVDFRDLPIKVERAYLQAQKDMVLHGREREEKKRIQEELEWMKWKHDHDTDFKEHAQEASIFYFLKTYLAQGAGIGVIVSLLKMMFYRPTIQDGHYLISEDIMELLKSNLSFADKTIQAFSDLDYIIVNQIPLQKISCYELYELLFQVKSDLDHYASIKSQKVYMSENRDSYKNLFVMVNLEYIEKVFIEFLMNAYKFSRADSSIMILINLENKQFEVMYLSSPFLNEGERFPDNFETIVFNPFYRLNNVVYDAFNTLDFGLGLTYVDKIIKKHNGKIKISRVMDHTSLHLEEEEKMKLNISVSFPVL